jgi:hypothetical protein
MLRTKHHTVIKPEKRCYAFVEYKSSTWRLIAGSKRQVEPDMQVCGTAALGFIVTQAWRQMQAIMMSFSRISAVAYVIL